MATADQKTGLATQQVDRFIELIQQVSTTYAGASDYQPGSIL
jgi:hypothetical protein